MIYLIIAAILTIVMFGYFKLADRFNIIDKPNERSSHDRIVIRGGGVLFPLAALMWAMLNGWQYPYLIVGLLMVAIISFLDDIYTLSNKIRLLVQFTAAALVLYQAGLSEYNVWLWISMLVLVVGWKNAFNFMDGINGITALYALSAIGAFFYLNREVNFTDGNLIIYTGISVLVFAFYNVRKKARCFAGDVGAVALAFLLAFWMVGLILATGEALYLLFFAVYGVDAVLTIIHRLVKKENIFKAHRSHIYQYLANEMKLGHVPVSLIYFTLQSLMNTFLIYAVRVGLGNNWLLFTALLLSLCIVYIILKSNILRRLKLQENERR